MARKKKDGYKRVTVKMAPYISETLKTKGKGDERIFAVEQFMLGSLNERLVLDDREYSDTIIIVGYVRPLYDIRRTVGFVEEINDELTEAVIMVSKCRDDDDAFFDDKILHFNVFHNYNHQKGSIRIMNAYLKKETEDDENRSL